MVVFGASFGFRRLDNLNRRLQHRLETDRVFDLELLTELTDAVHELHVPITLFFSRPETHDVFVICALQAWPVDGAADVALRFGLHGVDVAHYLFEAVFIAAREGEVFLKSFVKLLDQILLCDGRIELV